MSLYGSQSRMNTIGHRSNSRPDLSSASFRNDGGPLAYGNGYQGGFNEGYNQVFTTTTFSKGSMHGGGGSGGGGGGEQKMIYNTMGGGSGGGGGGASVVSIQNRAMVLQSQCQEYLQRAQHIIQTGGPAMEVEKLMSMSVETLEHLKRCAMDLQHMRVPHDFFMSIEDLQHMQGVIQQNMGGMSTQRWSNSLGSGDEPRSFNDAMAWIGQQKRLIETAPWGDDAEALEQQTMSHKKYHNSIQRSQEVDRARDELNMNRDKPRLNALEQEWSSLQKMSDGRFVQLRELQGIIDEISRAIMWVNEREEEELVFDWGDKNIEQYIPRKQEGYSKMMSALEEKEKELNKLKTKVDGLLNNNHPAADKIEAYMDTLQTQWSWLLQITKCIHVHLKENAAYQQFFKEANETNNKLKKQHEHIRSKFTCDKQTPLETLQDLLKTLEKEKERILENKRQVQSLVTKSKSIVRLKPRNPEEKSSSTVMVKALCDFKQDQKSILKDNEGILKDNSQRSKWLVTGPGGLDMLIPSVCLLIPPPNPLSISLANMNDKYYDAIMGIWSQLYINIKSLISWQYCVKDIAHINSLTVNMLSKMRPEEYRSVIKRLETHYQEFLRTSQDSDIFGEDEKKTIKGQYAFAQNHYDGLVIQLPTYTPPPTKVVTVVTTEPPSNPDTTKITKTHVTKVTTQTPPATTSTLSVTLLSDLDALRRKLEVTETSLTYHLHVPLGENAVHECNQHLQKLQVASQDLDSLHDEYIRLRERILKQLSGIPADSEQAKYLRSQLEYINLRIADLQGLNNAYFNRLSSLKDMLLNLTQAEDVVKVHEALLTEKDTTSLDTRELEEYRNTLKQMRLDLDQRKGLLSAMDSELASAVQYNSQISQNFHKCDVDLFKYSEQVGQLTDRWRRIQTQIDSRMWDLEKQEKQLRHYQQSSGSLEMWVDNSRKRQDGLQTVKFTDIQALMDHLSQQKALHNEIKGQHEKVEDVQKDAETCATSIKDYELQLASYSAGLETLLNIPIKRTVLKSPATVIRQEATDLQANYIELLTRSGDYQMFLGQMLKNMEELKMRNTKIELLEEDLKRLNETFQDRNQKNHSLEEALARYKLELNLSQEKLLSMEEVKMTTVIQANATRESLESTQNQLKDLNDRLSRLRYQLDEEMRKRRLAEERYTSQQEEYESAMRRRQKELEELNWSKIDHDKVVKDKERELERLKILLEEEAARRRGAESEISKVRTQHNQEISHLKQTFETEIHVTKTSVQKSSLQREDEAAGVKLICDRLTEEKMDLEEELRRIRLSIAQREEQRNRAEQEVHQQRASMAEEIQRRSELEVQLRTLVQRSGEDDLRLKEANNINQEKTRKISLLKQNLEEEERKRRSFEMEISQLRKVQTELQMKNTAYLEAMSKLQASEKERSVIHLQLEKQTSLKTKAEQSASKLQSHIQELQCSLDTMESQLEKQKKTAQEEFTRRKRLEAELERVTSTCREHTTTIASLRSIQEKTSNCERRYDMDIRALQEALDKSVRDLRLTTDKLNQMAEELKNVKQQLLQEQARSRELNQRCESLYKTIEEKSRLLNENTAEVDRLKNQAQSMTKERLRLEEELRTSKQERDDLRSNKVSVDKESRTQITALHLQLQSSNKKTMELEAFINDLTKEQARSQELNQQCETLHKTIEEKSRLLNENTAEVDRLKSQMQSMTKERLRLEEELRMSKQERDDLRSNRVSVDEESCTQITSLHLQLQSSNKKTMELEAFINDLTKEQTRSQELNQQCESLHKTIEEKSRLLNENTAEVDRLKSQVQSMTKERLRLEEELRTSKQERDDLRSNRVSVDKESRTQITALHLQLQSSSKKTMELEALINDLTKEQARSQELNQQCESLHKTIEEKSRLLNENTAEVDRLKSQVQSMTKERLRLEEELRTSKQERDDLRSNRVSVDEESRTQITALHLQLQSSSKKTMELEALINDLTKEQARSQELNQQCESLRKTIEEKSRLLNENTAEVDKLKIQMQSMTKERLRLEEELRTSKQERDDLRSNRESVDEESRTQITALHLQLQSSSKKTMELEAFINDLTKEQARSQELNQQCESLHKTIEEKSRLLNENTAEVDKLKSQMQSMTKERLRLEEELRMSKQERDDLRSNRVSVDKESHTQITALNVQLQSSNKKTMELEAFINDLTKEQARSQELNQQCESLRKTIEEKSRLLNENTAEVDRLKNQAQSMTKERLRLEEELRTSKQERDDLRSNRDSVDKESRTQITALHLQLQSSSKKTMELEAFINDLTKEQAHSQELNQQCESLRKTIEEKSRLLNENTAEVDRLKNQAQSMTKERLRLEEELRTSKQERDDLRSNRESVDKESRTQITALHLQLQISSKKTMELEAFINDLTKEQARSQELNQQCESLRKTIEEKSRLLNENTAEVDRLKSQTQSMTKERLRLEEELRTSKQERDDLRSNRVSVDEESRTQITALHLQLQSSNKKTLELEAFINDLTKEQARSQELNQQCESLRKTIEEKSRLLNENTAEVDRLKSQTQSMTKERLRLEEELRTSKQERDDLRSNRESVDKESRTQITALHLQLQSSSKKTMELEAFINDLTKEQARSQELNQQCESLRKTIEEKSRLLNENTAEVDRLKSQTQSMTKERLRLEEELRTSKQERDDLRSNRVSVDEESRTQITALHLQLQSSNKKTLELEAFINDLTKEQARSQELNQQGESLRKTIEEKSRLLNENTAEVDRLKSQTQSMTKERLRLEEELRMSKQERDDLRSNRESVDKESRTQITALHLQLQSSSKKTMELEAFINNLTKEREKLKLEIDKIQKQSIETSMMIQESKCSFTELKQEKESLLSKMKMLDQDKLRQQRIQEELKLSLETELRNKQRLVDENTSVRKELTYFKSQFELRDSEKRQCDSDRERADRERSSLKSEVERLKRELRSIEERYKSQLLISEKEAKELSLKRDTLKREILMLQQKPSSLSRQTQTDEKVSTIDPSKLLFDGVRRKVSAHQLCDCGIISKSTLEQLLMGRKTVDEVAVDIQLSLKGTGTIAGMTRGSQGKMPFTEAKNKDLLSPESALMLLEAQAATGYIMDPAFNEKMPVDTACSRGIVDTEDRDVLLTAEAASAGFKDPYSGKLLSVGQVLKQGRIDKPTAIRLLQAQESVGGILDPVLSVFLPKDLALDRNLIDEDLYMALNKKPACYLDPTSGEKISYSDLKLKCKIDPVSGLLLLPGEETSMTVKGLRGNVSIKELIDSQLLDETDLQKINQGTLTSQDIEDRLKHYLYGSTCIAGIYDEAKDRTMPFYMAMKEGLIMRGTTLELLEAQAASGFMIDPVNNVFLTVDEAVKRGLVGKEFKNKLMSAEKAVVGYTDPATGKKISLFEAIDKDLIEKGHGIRLLEAQIASGGIIDPRENHRIDIDVAYKRGYFNKEMNEILTYEGDDTKGFFDPNNKENLTYLQLKDRCIKDPKTGLVLLPLTDKNKKAQETQESRTNVLRKRRVVIVDPDTGLEMTVREAYHRELIDYDTFLDLSEQECEWEEITVKGANGATRVVVVDKKTGTQYDIHDCLERGVIEQNSLDQYRTGKLTLTEFADLITRKSSTEMTITASTVDDVVTCISPTQATPSSPKVRQRFKSISITLSPPEMFDDLSPVGAIFDTETLEKITILEGLKRGIVDGITAQRLLEAQASTGGIINPSTSQRLSLQDAVHQTIIDDAMASKLKASQKAYTGFEDVKTKRKMSAAEAMKEKWLPYEAGQRFLEFQYLTGGLLEPESGQRVSIEEAIRRKWLDGREAQKLQDTRNHQKNLTCPKTKLKISYKQAMDSCMVEESNGMKMLQASSMSTKGISSPYNVSNPGSRSGSRQGSRASSRSGSRRGSVDYSSSYSYSFSSVNKSFSSNSLS